MRHGNASGVIVAAVALACAASCDGEPDETHDEPAEPSRDACAGGVFGIAAYDALYSHTIAGVPALLATNAEAVVRHREELEPLVVAAARADASPLSVEARVALQNDAWGFVQRLLARPSSEPAADALIEAGRRLVARLSPTAAELDALSGDGEIPQVLPRAQGFREMESELPSMQHERLFGHRRAFRIFQSREWIALAGQLYGIDRAGRVHATSIVGEVEMLRREEGDGLAVEARVLAIDRRRLRCGEPALVEHDEVQHVPDLGSNGFLLALPAPEPIATMPCAHCHDEEGHLMSLPTEDGDPAARRARMLREAQELAVQNGVGR